jgi:hypothetical protein
VPSPSRCSTRLADTRRGWTDRRDVPNTAWRSSQLAFVGRDDRDLGRQRRVGHVDILSKSVRLIPVAIVAMLATPAVANAHLRSDVVAVDYRATVTTQKGPFEARVYETDRALRLVVTRGHSVIVLGYLGEPLLRVDDRGTAVNAASPSASRTGLLKKSQLVSGRTIAWYRLSDRGAVIWHDSRLRGLPPGVSRAVWTVPLLVDGKRGRLRGELNGFPKPALWPWLLLAAMFVAAVAAVPFSGNRRRVASGAIGFGVLAALAFVASASAFAFDASASPGTWIFGADGLVFVALGLGILIKGPQHLHVGAAAGLGLLALTFALTKAEVFFHPVVLAVVPGWAARLAVTAAVCSGVAAAALGCVSYISPLSQGSGPGSPPEATTASRSR